MKLALIAVLACAIAVSASYPRLTTLGGDARLFVSDYVEMWAYPGTISGYQFATAESEDQNNSDGWFGLVKDFDGTTFGVTVNHGDMLEFLVHPGSWGLIVGVDYEKNMILGDSLVPETTDKNMGFDANWGTEIGLFGDYSDLAIGFGYNKNDHTEGDFTTGESDILAGGSVRGHQDAFFNLFPIISANLDMNTVDDGDDETDNATITSIAFDLGAGTNHMVAPKTLIVAGAFVGLESTSFGGDQYEGADGAMDITIPRITGGVEQSIGKFFVLRAGATSNTVFHSQGDVSAFNTSFTTNFGIGLKWDNFTMDATIGEDFLHDGPDMIGGTGPGFMGQLAATYTF